MLFFFKIKKKEKISAQAMEAEAVAKRDTKPTFENNFCGMLFSGE
ncbi:hypothetical protein [Anaerofustis stercorihominis]|nr:hypothetical protein [Anaerofustis stercorihominis]